MPQAIETTERNTAVVRLLIDEVMNAGDLSVIDRLYAHRLAAATRAWIGPFQASFPDMRMETVALVAEGDTVAGRFRCSGTHLGEWLGHPPTGRRFERIDEVWFFTFDAEGRIARAWGLEDTLTRLEQLGLR